MQEKVRKRKVTRELEITLETHNLQFVAIHRRTVFVICRLCGERKKLLPPEEFTGVSPRLIYRLIEKQKVYFIELPNGSLLVCNGCVEREEEVI